MNIKRPEPVTHLYRGAPAVRSWSKYQHTIDDWTLCGIKQKNAARPFTATEDASKVSCPFCIQLMQPSARPVARNPILGRKQDVNQLGENRADSRDANPLGENRG